MTKVSNLFLIGLVTLYIQIIPGLGETQPWLILFTIGLALLSSMKKITIDPNTVILIIIVLVIYISTITASLISQIFELESFLRVSFFLIITTGVAFWKIEEVSVNSYLLILFCILFYAICQFLQVPGFSILNSMLFGRGEISAQLRGISLLAPEQSYMGMMLVILYYLGYRNVKNFRSTYTGFMVFIIICLLLFMLRSAICLYFLLIIILHYFWERKKFTLALSLVFCSLLYLLNDRIHKITNAVVSIHLSMEEFFTALLIAEPSGTVRLATSFSSIVVFVNNILGCGFGCFRQSWFEYVEPNSILLANFIYERSFVTKQHIFVQAAPLNILADTGILSLIFCLLLIYGKHRKFDKMRVLEVLPIMVPFLFFQHGYFAPYLGFCIAYSIIRDPVSDYL